MILRFPDANTEAASSPASEAAAQPDVKPSAPSPEKGEKTLSEVVETAAKESLDANVSEKSSPDKKEEPAAEKEVEKEEPDKPAEAEKAEDKAETDDESLPFHKHPRFQEVIKERDTAKQEAEELKPQAQRLKSIDSYCQQNGITNEEFSSALEIAALLHKDPKAARQRLNEYVENIDVALGDKLPSDLQKKIDDGVIDIETAKEVASARAKTRTADWQVKSTQQRFQEMQAQSMTDAVNSWEANKRVSDPDYAKKFEMLRDRSSFLYATKRPSTPQEAVALAEEAYVYVNKMLSSFVPKPPAKKALTTNGSSTKSEPDFVLNDLEKDLPTLVNRIASQHSRA